MNVESSGWGSGSGATIGPWAARRRAAGRPAAAPRPASLLLRLHPCPARGEMTGHEGKQIEKHFFFGLPKSQKDWCPFAVFRQWQNGKLQKRCLVVTYEDLSNYSKTHHVLRCQGNLRKKYMGH